MKHLFFVFNPLTRSDQKSLQQISGKSLCGLSRAAVDMDPAGGDGPFLKCSCCGKDIVRIKGFYIKDKKKKKTENEDC